jgi:hypothetical protein
MRLALGVACAMGLVQPSSAGTVTAASRVELPFSVLRSDLTELPAGAVSVETGGIDLQVARTTPGVSAATDSDTARITNLLDVEIEMIFDDHFLTFADFALDDPRERATALASWQVLADGVLLDRSSRSVTPLSCTGSFPCAATDIDPGLATFRRTIGPGETLRFDIEGSVRAELALIPVPPASGLMLLGIGALGWLGRRRAHPSRAMSADIGSGG